MQNSETKTTTSKNTKESWDGNTPWCGSKYRTTVEGCTLKLDFKKSSPINSKENEHRVEKNHRSYEETSHHEWELSEIRIQVRCSAYTGLPRWLSVRNPPPAKQETRVWALGQEAPRRSTWQPSPLVLPGKSHGRRSWWATAGHGLATEELQQLHDIY